MSRKIELLAPGGDVNAVKAAIVAGANAVYCGLDTFNDVTERLIFRLMSLTAHFA